MAMNTTHEEQIRQVIRQLSVEQTVYIAPGNAPDLPAKDIRLETAKISEIPDTGHIIRIRKPCDKSVLDEAKITLLAKFLSLTSISNALITLA